MADKIEMKFPGNTKYLGALRLAASGIAGSLDYALNEIEDLKSCVSEACLLLLCGQECAALNIKIEITERIIISVSADDPKPANDGEFEDFSEEISRIMIESLSDEAEFNEDGGILRSVSFSIGHRAVPEGGA